MVKAHTAWTVRTALGLAALAFCVSPGFAQTSTSTSGAGAVSGSLANSNSTGVVKSTNVNSNKNTNVSNSNANSGSASSAKSSSAQANAQSITFTSPSTQTINNVPNIYAPGLAAAGAEVCLGSVSAGGAGAGFGLSIGGTYVDQECQLRLNARTLATLGYTVAAREEMCLDSQVRAAMLAAGTPCAADAGAHAAPYNALASQSASAAPLPPVSAPGCERRYQLFGGWYEVCN
jgi:alkylhydroperoxidase/carboxymuconolactone decarboxylase family protein YurZ